MRGRWEIIPFEKSIQKVKYTTKVPSSDYLPVGAFPIVSQEEGLISGYWNNEADVFHHSRPVVIFGDHTRIIKYVDFDFVLGADGVKILLPVDGLSAKFLSYYLRWYKVPSLGYSRHFKLLKEASVPVPPVQEQEKIVAELDSLSGIIEKKKQQLKELDKLAQSIFYDMFGTTPEEKGFPVKLMGEIGTFQRGAGLQKKDFVEDGMPCIHYGQIHTAFGSYTTKHLTTIPKNLYDISKIAHPGDLLMVLTSEDVEGSCKSTAWLGEYDIAVGSDAAIFSNHSQNAIYLSYCTRTRSFFNEKSKYANGFKVTHIKTGDIGTIPIAVPPRTLQDLFAKKIEAIERQKELIKKSIQETETLFNSRMDYWFN